MPIDPNQLLNNDLSQIPQQAQSGINFSLLSTIKQDSSNNIIPISNPSQGNSNGLASLGQALTGLSKMPLNNIENKINTQSQTYGNPLQQTQQPGQTNLSPKVNQQYSGQLLDNASKELGLRASDPSLQGFLQKANPGLNPSKTPWCAGFVNSVLKAGGMNGTGSLAAKSFLNYGTPVQKPSQGDIVVFNDLTGQNRPEHGHVGFVKGIDPVNGTVTVLGGNQGGSVSVKTYPISAVAGFRRPPTADQLAGVTNPHPELKHTMDGIIGVESQGNFNAVSKPSANGDRAYGYSQIMGSNIPSWTKEALGYPMTPQQFLKNPEAQRITTSYKVNQLLNSGLSPQDTASTWFSGRTQNKAGNARDAYGTTVPEYVNKFNRGYLSSKMNMTQNESKYETNEVNPPIVNHEDYEKIVQSLDQGKSYE